MRSIEITFKELQKLYPNVGDYVCLHRAIKHRKFTKRALAIWFDKLVPKSDHLPSHREGLINQLFIYSNSQK